MVYMRISMEKNIINLKIQKINKAVIKQRKKADCGYFNSSK